MRILSLALLGLLTLISTSPLQAWAKNPTIATTNDWHAGTENIPAAYTHVRDGDVSGISLENYLNRYRERMGVPRFTTSETLQKSAQAHAEYLSNNGTKGNPHGETAGLPGFTGETIQERCNAAGYTKFCTEVQAGGSSSGDGYSAIDALMMTPYHRLSMVYPFFTEIGCAIEQGWFVCDIGFESGDYGNEYEEEVPAIMYPYNGQTISTTFYVSENPMPYPSLAGTFIGPTIMYWPLGKTVTEASVGLYDITTQTAITSLVHLDLEDTNADGAIFFNPTSSLETNHEYIAHVTGTTDDGETFKETWTFKTQKSENVDFPNVNEAITYDAGVRWNNEEESIVQVPSKEIAELTERLAGHIMLAVDRYGEAYYIDPVTRARYYLKDGETAYEFLRTFGLGITNADLALIPESGSGENPSALAQALAGRIVLQVEEHGEAWYIHPETFERYYMADGEQTYAIMRELSLGTMYAWIEGIPEGAVN